MPTDATLPAADAAGSAAPATPVAAGMQGVEDNVIGGGNKRGRTATAQGKDYTKTPTDSKTIHRVLCKATLSMGQRIRDLEGGLAMFFIFALDHKLITDIKEAGQTYDSQVKSKPGHGLGPPAIHTFLAVLSFIVNSGDIIGSQITAEAHKMLDVYKKFNNEDKSGWIGSLTLSKKNPKKNLVQVKVTFGLTMNCENSLTFRDALIKLGGSYHPGKPAMTSIEVVTQDILLQLEK
jgi:hypothetical protein